MQTTPEFRWDVLLSHNSRDKPKVRPIAEALRDGGLRVWFDEWSIGPGDDIFAAIEDGLQRTRVLVLCMTPAAFGSDWVQLERGTALFRDPMNRRRRFIPVLLEECTVPDVLRRHLYIDLRDPANHGLARLQAALAPPPVVLP